MQALRLGPRQKLPRLSRADRVLVADDSAAAVESISYRIHPKILFHCTVRRSFVFQPRSVGWLIG